MVLTVNMEGHSQTRQLPTALQLHILSLLPPNERALSGRFVSREACDVFSEPQHCTASLSQPLPPHAAPWAVEAGQHHLRQLPFNYKFELLCAAARSGSEGNLEVAWTLLQPSVFPELLQNPCWSEQYGFCNPGLAAVRAGHRQLLGWLMRHCPALVRPDTTLAAAVEHCDLAGLQAAWEVVGGRPGSANVSSSWPQRVLDAAAESTVPDAVAKMEWMLGRNAGQCGLFEHTATAAVCAGGQVRLQWLEEQGCPIHCERRGVPVLALQKASLDMLQWLVDDAGWPLPEPGAGDSRWDVLMQSAAMSADGVAKLRWLQERGAPPLAAGTQLLSGVLMGAARAGQAEVLRYLLSTAGQGVVLQAQAGSLAKTAVRSGSTATTALLLQEGLVFTSAAYHEVAGSLEMVWWLVCEAGVSTDQFTLHVVMSDWPNRTPADGRGLPEAVRLLVDGGCRCSNPRLALSRAASWGNLALIQYLHGQQQEGQVLQQWERWLNREAFVSTAMGGCEALLEWLAAQPGCFDGPMEARPYLAAAKRGDRCTLDSMRRLGVRWGARDVVVLAVLDGCSMPALRWLVEHGAPVGTRAAVEVRMDRGCDKAVWLLGLAGPAEASARGEVVDLTWVD